MEIITEEYDQHTRHGQGHDKDKVFKIANISNVSNLLKYMVLDQG
jgi:hypothetical protein